MNAPVTSQADFIKLFEEFGAHKLARKLKISVESVFRRRARLEIKIGRQIKAPNDQRNTRHAEPRPYRIEIQLPDGVVLIGSDAHYWPDRISTAHKALVKFCRDLAPAVVVMNGDAFDGASISRHPPLGWEKNPTVIQEIEAVQARLHEIELAVSPRTQLVWPAGNHDQRFETRLATVAPEYAKANGFHLKDHFSPRWQPCWSLLINDDVVIKHRFKGGIHAVHNNTLWAGKTMVTGHLHSLKVTPFSDYNGTRWGVDTGTLDDPNGPQFVNYSEDNPKNHRSGFIVLTFRDGRLLWPEIVSVYDRDHVEFRGQVINVNKKGK